MSANMGTRVMLSTPPAMAKSTSPAAMAWAAKWTACWLEPHMRFKLTAGTSLGSLERSTPSRPTFAPCSPTWVTHPVTTSPMRPGSMPVRSKRASRTLA